MIVVKANIWKFQISEWVSLNILEKKWESS